MLFKFVKLIQQGIYTVVCLPLYSPRKVGSDQSREWDKRVKIRAGWVGWRMISICFSGVQVHYERCLLSSMVTWPRRKKKHISIALDNIPGVTHYPTSTEMLPVQTGMEVSTRLSHWHRELMHQSPGWPSHLSVPSRPTSICLIYVCDGSLYPCIFWGLRSMLPLCSSSYGSIKLNWCRLAAVPGQHGLKCLTLCLVGHMQDWSPTSLQASLRWYYGTNVNLTISESVVTWS